MEKCWLRSSSPWYIWLLNCGSSVSWCFPEAGSDLQEGETILSCCGDVPLELPPPALTLLVTNVEREWGMQSNLLQEQHIISQLTHECSLANSSLGEGFKNKKELSIEGSYPLVGWSKNILLKCILRAFLVIGKSHQPIGNFQNVFCYFFESFPCHHLVCQYQFCQHFPSPHWQLLSETTLTTEYYCCQSECFCLLQEIVQNIWNHLYRQALCLNSITNNNFQNILNFPSNSVTRLWSKLTDSKNSLIVSSHLPIHSSVRVDLFTLNTKHIEQIRSTDCGIGLLTEN